MMTRAEREVLQLQSVRQWERERQARIEGYAASLTHLRAAIDAIPSGDGSANHIAINLEGNTTYLRGRMRAIFDEPNPFVK